MTTLVAEIGMNHDGHWDRAYELIRQAALSGADIAKFQVGWRYKPGELNHISPELAVRLKEWCQFHSIDFMASIINDEAFDIVADAAPDQYKIASRTVIENPKLVEKVIATGKTCYVSLGWWKEKGWPFGPPSDSLRYIFCISEYPTYPASLARMPERFEPTSFYGYSDHTHGIEACLLALSRGALFIEKHFTLEKTIRSVHNDHILSATPEEFAVLHRHGRALSKLAGASTGRVVAPSGPPPLPQA